MWLAVSSFDSKSGSGTGRGRCRDPRGGRKLIDLHPGVGGCQHSAFLQNQVFLLDVSFSTDGKHEVVVGKIKGVQQLIPLTNIAHNTPPQCSTSRRPTSLEINSKEPVLPRVK